MALAAAAGHRVVLVFATRGEEGEVEDGRLGPGESLGDHRVAEAFAAAEILGVHRTEFLGYRDSGMMGWAQNDEPSCFWRADLDEAAGRLATLLAEEEADVLTVYDDHGGYGHPDHIQVHRVGHRAADLAGTDRVYEATISREAIKAMSASLWTGEPGEGDLSFDAMGTPEDDISTAVDVRSVLDTKRSAMAAHASQIAGDSWFFRLEPAVFSAGFGTEWFRRTRPAFTGRIPEDREDGLF